MLDRKKYVEDRILQGGKGEKFEDYYNFPRFINLETTNNCTARCVMCGIEEWRKNIRKPYMDDALFDKISNEIIYNREWVQKVAMFVGNEPLMDKKLAQRIEKISKSGIRVSITTNASLMDKEKAIEILNSGIDRINFSIDSLCKKTYENIRVGLKFEEVLGNILQFIKLRDSLKKNVSVRISVIKSEVTKNDIPYILSFWEKFLDSSFGDGIKVDDLSLSMTDKVRDKGVDLLVSDTVDNEYNAIRDIPCYVLFNTMVIKADGQVALCCVDQCRNVVLGDLDTQSIKEVWQESKKLQSIREIHLQKGRGAMSVCDGCFAWIDTPNVI
ncbi:MULTISPECIES: radical SAM/SPASM domain-containing protein [Helicobacter]|uniref:Radical SAM protein n=1 Tax=Helicobacter ibis TaxID=2962633 RepID=A0ABT4VEH0_9HELI|nr:MULTISPECIES: radical SAM/SPASM domain-containing protein [Helicobacter]MDA3966387.1 radical SAM protein [Helicobacter sp. WB40]MDA3968997.1 radical SAM protein [Helicobacter ibis]